MHLGLGVGGGVGVGRLPEVCMDHAEFRLGPANSSCVLAIKGTDQRQGILSLKYVLTYSSLPKVSIVILPLFRD